MKHQPFFSFVFPTYNRAQDLEFAIFCILNQTFQDFEIIISDNCSSDNTFELIEKLKNKKIVYKRNKENNGYIDNVRISAKYPRGKYVFLHGDDDFLLYNDTLEKIYKEIIRYKPGYIRVNYLSLALDKKHIFAYKVKKPFQKNKFIPANLQNEDVISFITDSDPYFITGVIYKNDFPKNILMLNSDPYPWFDILFYDVKKYGGIFITEYNIVGTWSRRKRKKNTEHHLFSMKNGKLKSENYFAALKAKLSPDQFKKVLHDQLILFYVGMFPVIKTNVGNQGLLQICKRLSQLDSSITKNIYYWIYFIPSYIFPEFFLVFFRYVFFVVYIRMSQVKNNDTLIKRLSRLKHEFMKKYGKNDFPKYFID